MARRRLPGWLALALTAGAVAWAFAGLPGETAANLPSAGDCEAARPGPIRQPANAWSSLALTTAGLVLLIVSPGFAGGDAPVGRRGGKPQRRRPGEARGQSGTRQFSAAALVAAGVGAFLYHAGLTAWAARLDGILVALLVGTLALHALARIAGEAGPRGARRRIAWRRLAAWPLLALGAACWWLGQSGGPWCRPDSLWQAHAAWHLLAAGAIGSWLLPGRSSPQSPAPSSLRAERPSSP